MGHLTTKPVTWLAVFLVVAGVFFLWSRGYWGLVDFAGIPVYPISLSIVGVFLFFAQRKFGDRKAIGLMIAGMGTFDSLVRIGVGSAGWDPFFPVQLSMGVGGYLIAGLPRLSLSSGYFFLLITVFALTAAVSTPYYHAYEACLFLYLYKGTDPRKTFLDLIPHGIQADIRRLFIGSQG